MTITFVLIMWLHVPRQDQPKLLPPREFNNAESCLAAGREFEAKQTQQYLWFCLPRRSSGDGA